MNYPIWEVPASGLLIAVIAIVHVYVSHFAVGGGLFLVLAEKKARRENDPALLEHLKKLSKFFILLTLVFGAMTGVGIWFTIGLVHPSATSSLINTFVWGWAIEWTFFVVEIAAAMVYYYGWGRLDAKTHVTIGWIYFWAAWASLLVINGILTFMLTPGEWVSDRSFWSGWFNPTMFPSLVTRTAVCIGLAGLYSLFTLAWLKDLDLKSRFSRWTGLGWVVPAAVLVPLSLIWYLGSALGAGVPADEILGAGGQGIGATIAALFTATGDSGHPVAQRGAFVCIVASILAGLLALFMVLARSRTFTKVEATLALLLGLFAMGGAEWVREDLRKPYVIGRFMFVNGVRLPAPSEAPQPPPADAARMADRYSLPALARTGVLQASLWSPDFARLPGEGESLSGDDRADREAEAGREIFKLQCTACHTRDGYMATEPLVEGMSVGALERILSQLALPEDESGDAAGWARSDLRLRTWRGRRMPPFAGTEPERHALAVYLARLGGTPDAGLESPATSVSGGAVFEDYCAPCHGPDGDWPMEPLLRGRDAGQLYDIIGQLPEINENMPDFEGTDEERRALSGYLAERAAAAPAGEEDQP